MPGPIVSRVTRRLTGIYLRQGETFIAMRGTPSEAEDVLPQLVAENPEMLAGEHEENGGHRWLLIERGSPVSETEGAAGRWSADHLFIDQDRVPTVVEAKRSINPDPRREVVAQMLDYAARVFPRPHTAGHPWRDRPS